MIIKYNVTLLLLFFLCRFSFADTYIWEEYDDFSGSTLDTNKWGTKYLGGGIKPYVAEGKLVLSSGVGNPSGTKVVKPGWENIFEGNDGGQSWVYAKDTSIYGLESEFVIPSSASSYSGLQLGVGSLNPLSYATVELNPDPNISTLYTQGFGFYHYKNSTEIENFGSTQRGLTHRLGVTLINGQAKLYVDGKIKYEASSGNFNTDMFFLNGFNDYQQTGLAFQLNADNTRVLRRSTTTSLDGSTLVLSTTVGVSETLAFENGTFTSTFVDPQEGTIVKTGQNYTLDQITHDTWKITLEDGDTYSFDDSKSTGNLEDFTTGNFSGDNSYELISGNLYKDLQGSGVFTFKHYEWEDYDDFSTGSLDSRKWDVWWGAGGALAVVENGALKLSGSGSESDPASSVIPDDLTYTSNLPSKHSVALINQDDVYGVQAEFMIPANPSDDTGLNFIFFDWATNGSKQEFGPELEYRSESGLRTEFAYTDPESGEDEQITRPAEFGIYYKMSLIHTDTTNSMYLNGELIKEFSSAGFEPDTIGFAAFNDDGLPYATYVKNVRVLRRSQKTTEPDPVTVVSDPNGQAVVVQVGDEYQWNSTLDGVTLWSVSGSESEGDWYALTAKFSGGKLIYGFEFANDVSDTGANSAPYEIDENGYIKSLEGDGDYQYYNPVSVENGVIGTIQNDQGVESVADNGVNQVDQWFFTTRAAAEEYYYSKVPVPVTVVSDPNGQPIVVQVGDEYQWKSTLDGITLWMVHEDDDDGWFGATVQYESGMQKGSIGLTDELGINLEVNHPYIIDENGMIKVTEDTAFQYYQVTDVENGVIVTADDSTFPLSDTSRFFTTREAAEEYYYSKVGYPNPNGWLWFDHYPWVYSNKEQGWLYFKPSGGKLMYFSHKNKIWREFSQ